MILPSQISHHHKVNNITISPTSLSPLDVGDEKFYQMISSPLMLLTEGVDHQRLVRNDVGDKFGCIGPHYVGEVTKIAIPSHTNCFRVANITMSPEFM